MNEIHMTLYAANCRGSVANTSYPNKIEVTCAADVQRAAAQDHVCAQYADGVRGGVPIKAHRSNDTFMSADCLPVDMDNTHSHDPADWKDLEDVRAAFPGVAFYAVPSRNHMRVKTVKGIEDAARPKYHIYFSIAPITEAAEYRRTKEQVLEVFPFFDSGAKDAARFFFGVLGAQAQHVGGDMNLTEFLKRNPPPAREIPCAASVMPVTAIAAPVMRASERRVIPHGERNTRMSALAMSVMKKYGADDGRAMQAFREEAGRCSPPLDASELNTIWKSARKGHREKVQTDPNYIPPETYEALRFTQNTAPDDWTDVGQAKKLAELYRDKLRHSVATGWLVYDGTKWVENDAAARMCAHELTAQQMAQAREMGTAAQRDMMDTNRGADRAADRNADAAEAARGHAEEFQKFARKYQHTGRVSATLLEATPYLQIDVDELDADGFLLNTPAGTIDLRSGKTRPHNPLDFLTKVTGCAVGDGDNEGAGMFSTFLDRVTCGDAELQDYLQMIAGMFAVGGVYRECLIIAYGGGGNGKSTLFNLLTYVFGDYAGNLSAETLTANCRKNKSPEYAELRGWRLAIASELEEGMRFDTAVIKTLCSTDRVQAEKKYKAPFSFVPSHTIVLYTNHLPKVGTNDRGTWDRLIVVPFMAKFRGQGGEILNYAKHLYEKAGGAVLSWIVEGARRFIEAQYKIEPPGCVKAAIGAYRDDNDWVAHFLESCCEIGAGYNQPSGELYQEYRAHCGRTGDYARSSADFRRGIEGVGYEWRKTNTGARYFGLRLAPSVYAGEFREVNAPTPWSS